MSATFLDFARINDSAAATSSKLQKQTIFAQYFRGLEESDLRLAVRFAAGRPFAATDERVLNVGWSTVGGVILSMLQLDPHRFSEFVVRSGEIGEAIRGIWPNRTCDVPLTLAQVADAFDELAAIGRVDRKREILAGVFSRCCCGQEAAFLAKIIFREMRSGAREGVLQAALADAFGKTLAQVQRCQLLVGDLDEVAVLAANNTLDAAAFRLFHPIQLMLATPQESAEQASQTLAGRTFLAEDKLDGIRAQVHKSANRVAMYTRTMDRSDQSFPDVVAEIEQLPGEFLLDGEIVPWRDGQVLPFAHIQRRLGRKALSAKILRENPARFVAFDILYREGRLLMDCPLQQRRDALAQLASGHTLLVSDAVAVSSAQQIAQVFDSARGRRNEGIVLKDPQSVYWPGRRGQWWLKLKTHLPTFDCVVTAAEYGHGKRRNVLSDYTFAVWDRDAQLPEARLVNVGKAYSGLTDAEIAQLTELFLSTTINDCGRVRQVTPKVVLEIACDQIQRSNRHASGYALRFPRIKRIRWDKRIQDADRLERVAELYQSAANTGRGSLGQATAEPMLFDIIEVRSHEQSASYPNS